MNAGRNTPNPVGAESVPRGTRTSHLRDSCGGLVQQKVHQKVQHGLLDFCGTSGCPPAVMLDVEGYHRHLTTRPPRDERKGSSGSQVPVPAWVQHDGGRASNLQQSATSRREIAVVSDGGKENQWGRGRTAPEPLSSLSPFDPPLPPAPPPGSAAELRWLTTTASRAGASARGGLR